LEQKNRDVRMISPLIDMQMHTASSPVRQQLILLKLSELVENTPDMSSEPAIGPSPQRQWIAEIGAILGKVSLQRKCEFDSAKSMFNLIWDKGLAQIYGLAVDVIEEIKLELELSGRAEVGNAYATGEIYNFFHDLKSIVNGAKSEIFLIDPYFDGEAFNNYLADVKNNVNVRIFTDRHTQDVKVYIDKHQAQFNSQITLKKYKKLHDRLIIVDNNECWITGGSINHAGNKSPTYLIPVGTEITQEKIRIYNEIWISKEPVTSA